VACLALAGFGSRASGAMIMLSTASSDETPAVLLNMTLDFAVSGNTLTITATNDTMNPSQFKINELFFNGPEGVTLAMDNKPGWTLATNVVGNIFGTFDFALLDGQGNNPHQLFPGEVEVFTFTILSGAPTDADFVTYFSTLPPGSLSAIAAAKFVGGPNDDSAYGAYIPAPGAAGLLLAPLALRRRRQS
jgi:hypothetical protein